MVFEWFETFYFTYACYPQCYFGISIHFMKSHFEQSPILHFYLSVKQGQEVVFVIEYLAPTNVS